MNELIYSVLHIQRSNFGTNKSVIPYKFPNKRNSAWRNELFDDMEYSFKTTIFSFNPRTQTLMLCTPNWLSFPPYLMARWRKFLFLLSFKEMSAPLSNNRCTVFHAPFDAASNRGVLFWLSTAFTSTPCNSKDVILILGLLSDQQTVWNNLWRNLKNSRTIVIDKI